jgi:hypothetical protein
MVELPNGQEVRLERLASDPLPVDGPVYLYWDPLDARVVQSPDQTVYGAVQTATFL